MSGGLFNDSNSTSSEMTDQELQGLFLLAMTTSPASSSRHSSSTAASASSHDNNTDNHGTKQTTLPPPPPLSASTAAIVETNTIASASSSSKNKARKGAGRVFKKAFKNMRQSDKRNQNKKRVTHQEEARLGVPSIVGQTTPALSYQSTTSDVLVVDPENPSTLQVQTRAQQGWNCIASEIEKGDILLHSAAVSPNRMQLDEKERERQRAQEWIRNGVEFHLWHCLVAMALYIAVSVLSFSFVFEEWKIVDSVYFALVTFSTIGYGDLVPDTNVSRIFTCVFALSGVACLGIALGVIGNSIMEAQETAVEKTKKYTQKRVLGLFRQDNNNSDNKKGAESSDEATATTTMDSEDSRLENANEKSHPIWMLLFHFSLVLMLLAVFAYFVASDPGIDGNEFNYFDALYYTIITASTVGYGDFAPQSQHGRLVAIIFIPLSVGAMGHFLSSVATVIMDSRRSAFQRQMDTQELSMLDLEIMDEDGDGNVTRAEYLEFMLIAMGKVDKDFIDQIRQSFARLDVDGTGKLSKDDMVVAARRKLHSTTKKLQLAQYKEQLLAQAEQAHRTPSNHRQTPSSFWDYNFAFVSKVFGKDTAKNQTEEGGPSETHSLL